MRSSRTLLSISVATISFAACQLHDVVRAHGDVPASPQMGDQARPASVLPPRGSGEYPHDLAVEVEIDLRVGQQAGLLADFCRDRHLTLRCDAHGSLLTLTSKSNMVIPKR